MGTGHPRFNAIFTAYYRPVVSYVARLVGSSDAAEDIVIEAFAALYDRPGQWNPEEDARRFVYRAAYNKALDVLRTDQTRARLLSRREDGQSPAMGSAVRDIQASLEQEEILEAVDRCIQEMPLQRRSVASLRWEQGYGNKEIAQMLGLSVKTVELHVSLALKTLREKLRDSQE